MWQWLSCNHEQEVQEITVVLICIYINWSTVLSLHTLETYLHLFLTLALDEGQCSTSHLGILFLVERPPAMRWMGGGVGPRTSLVAFEDEKNLLSLLWIEEFLACPTHSLFLSNFRDTKLKKQKFPNCFTNCGSNTDNLARFLEWEWEWGLLQLYRCERIWFFLEGPEICHQ